MDKNVTIIIHSMKYGMKTKLDILTNWATYNVIWSDESESDRAGVHRRMTRKQHVFVKWPCLFRAGIHRGHEDWGSKICVKFYSEEGFTGSYGSCIQHWSRGLKNWPFDLCLSNIKDKVKAASEELCCSNVLGKYPIQTQTNVMKEFYLFRIGSKVWSKAWNWGLTYRVNPDVWDVLGWAKSCLKSAWCLLQEAKA